MPLGRRVVLLDCDVVLLDCEVTFLDGHAALLNRGLTCLFCHLKPDAQLVALLSKLLELRGDRRGPGECLVQHPFGLVVIRHPGQELVFECSAM